MQLVLDDEVGRRQRCSETPALKSHSKLVQTMRSSSGRSSFGRNVNASGSKRAPHQGQASRGIGDGLPRGLLLKRRALARAESGRLSPLRPRTFGVAPFPTHRPISNGQLPYREPATSCRPAAIQSR